MPLNDKNLAILRRRIDPLLASHQRALSMSSQSGMGNKADEILHGLGATASRVVSSVIGNNGDVVFYYLEKSGRTEPRFQRVTGMRRAARPASSVT